MFLHALGLFLKLFGFVIFVLSTFYLLGGGWLYASNLAPLYAFLLVIFGVWLMIKGSQTVKEGTRKPKNKR